MASKEISRKDQKCISECIIQSWGDSSRFSKEQERDRQYEKCLSSCSICS